MAKKKKDLTIEDLAQMVAKGFDHTATDLLEVKQDVAGVKQDVAGVKQGLTEVKQEVAEVKQEVSKLSSKVDNLQNRFDVYAGLDRKVEKMDDRLTKVEKLVIAGK